MSSFCISFFGIRALCRRLNILKSLTTGVICATMKLFTIKSGNYPGYCQTEGDVTNAERHLVQSPAIPCGKLGARIGDGPCGHRRHRRLLWHVNGDHQYSQLWGRVDLVAS